MRFVPRMTARRWRRASSPARRDDGGAGPLCVSCPAWRRGEGAVHPPRPALRLGGGVVREGAVSAAGDPRDRRQAVDRGGGGLYLDLLLGRLHRHPAAEDV